MCTLKNKVAIAPLEILLTVFPHCVKEYFNEVLICLRHKYLLSHRGYDDMVGPCPHTSLSLVGRTTWVNTPVLWERYVEVPWGQTGGLLITLGRKGRSGKALWSKR